MDANMIEKVTKAPIINEASNGLKNTRGTLAMARTSDLIRLPVNFLSMSLIITF
jgi:ribosome-interacting GTPase 1